jgi:type I restriction enzyme S subunit
MIFPEVPLNEILFLANRSETPVSGKLYRQIGVRLWGEGAYEREPIDGAATQYQRLFQAKANDIIMNKIWARNGSVAVVPEHLDGCYGSNEFPMFIPRREKLEPRWFHWLTKTKSFWAKCDEKSRGTSGKNRIRPERFLEIEIPLPTLSEQRRIATSIDKMASRIEEAQRLRRQTTEATDLLMESAFSEVKPIERMKIEQLADVRGGIQKSPQRTPGKNPVRYLTVAHVQRNRILLSDPRYFEVSPDELERRRLHPGDVLIIEGNGSANQIGRTALFRGEITPCVHQNHVIRIRPDKNVVNPEYLNYYLNSAVGQAAVHSISRTSSGLRNLSVGRIRKIEVVTPPLHEQLRIVERLEKLHAKIGAVKRLQAETGNELAELLPNIVDRALSGELGKIA